MKKKGTNKILELLNAGKLIDDVSSWADVQVEIIKLDVKDALSRTMVRLIQFGFMALSGFLIFFLISFAASEVLNGVLESEYLGFLIVAAFYLAVLSSLFLFKKSLQRFIFWFVEHMILEPGIKSQNPSEVLSKTGTHTYVEGQTGNSQNEESGSLSEEQEREEQ